MTVSKKKIFERIQSKLMRDESGNAGVLMEVFFAVIIVIAVVIAFQLAPNLGYQVESANSIPSASNWNSTTNANIVTGVSIWSSSGGMLKATITIGVAAIALLALFGIFASRRQQGGGGGGM